jgi:hypothetical protein
MKRSHLVNFISLHYSFNPKHFRVVLIVGSESVVSLTQTLIWELLAQNLRTIEAVGQSSNASVWSLPNWLIVCFKLFCLLLTIVIIFEIVFLLRQGERSETWSPKNAMQSPKFDLEVCNNPPSLPKIIKKFEHVLALKMKLWKYCDYYYCSVWGNVLGWVTRQREDLHTGRRGRTNIR